MWSVPVILALAFTLALHPPRAGALPTGVEVTARAHHYYASSGSSNGNNSALIAIIVVALIVLTIFVFCIIVRCRKRRKEMRGSTATHHSRNETTRRSAGSGAPARRTTVNYTSIAERTGNALVETQGARTRSNNTTRQTGVSRRPTQNSTRSLPVYNEQAPDGDVVLLERVRRRGISENDEDGSSEDETENTPLTGAAPPYTASDTTSGIPRVTLTTIISRGSVSSVESLLDRSENPGSDATTAASSINVTEPEHARAPVVDIPETTVDSTTSSYGDVPTYEEATAATPNHTTDVPEAATPTGVEQR
ncbi:unnamed protein product [Rhizoctonia solani]|uniref:Uncharacterized protein n=1 Tax=Rhizoctonia solani TaxID=456999 RepID=A0A8H2X9L2_9AGAM|nr:unnamed protein product [Rhizoctonia solani]